MLYFWKGWGFKDVKYEIPMWHSGHGMVEMDNEDNDNEDKDNKVDISRTFLEHLVLFILHVWMFWKLIGKLRSTDRSKLTQITNRTSVIHGYQLPLTHKRLPPTPTRKFKLSFSFLNVIQTSTQVKRHGPSLRFHSFHHFYYLDHFHFFGYFIFFHYFHFSDFSRLPKQHFHLNPFSSVSRKVLNL